MDSTTFLSELTNHASRLGFLLTDRQKQQFVSYLSLLQTWNQKMNLTSIEDPRRILWYHFIDSLTLASLFPKRPSATLIDVGSGAGFPGAVCAILFPNWHICLVERIQKKAAFLLALRRELGLSFQVISDDLSNVKGTFDMAVSRATFSPDVWVQKGAPFVAPDGILFAMLGPKECELLCPNGFTLLHRVPYHIEQGTRLIQSFHRTMFNTA